MHISGSIYRAVIEVQVRNDKLMRHDDVSCASIVKNATPISTLELCKIKISVTNHSPHCVRLAAKVITNQKTCVTNHLGSALAPTYLAISTPHKTRRVINVS